MNKKYLIIVIIVLFLPLFVSAESISIKLSGYILLQVEERGEAWYVSPDDNMRYYLGRPEDAFEIMRSQGVGISNGDLDKIKNGNFDDAGVDLNNTFSRKHAGRIFLQVEKSGEAWYVNPKNYRKYYLGRPEDAFEIMRKLGLGITNDNLEKINVSYKDLTENYQATEIEKIIFDEINIKRQENGLSKLMWDDRVASVAREHSMNLADENKAFTGIGYSCTYPIIHHEGLVFGETGADRLNNRGIYDYSSFGENIFRMSTDIISFRYYEGSIEELKLQECEKKRPLISDYFDEKIHEPIGTSEKIDLIHESIKIRTEEFANEIYIKDHKLEPIAEDELITEMVEGWMDSPGHRANILKEIYNATGVGVAYINGHIIATQVFITKIECGYQNGICCEKEGYYPYCYQPMTCENMVCGQ